MLKITLLFWLLMAQFQVPVRRAERALQPPPQPASRFFVETRNIPQARIAGVVLPARGRALGTLFICHGWGGRKEFMYGLEWIRARENWNLVFFDFREHGQSSHSIHFSTLGYHEIWDVKAVVDYAEQRGLEKPYAVLGHSLGASVGLRWAAHDERISGVLAASPFRNARDASRRFVQQWTGYDISRIQARRGFAEMLDTVDLPTDVKRRADLRIWIMTGEHDMFPVSDQRAILDASPSQAAMKRLFIIPNGNHGSLWRWQGDATVPSHDQIIRDFLRSVASNR